MPGMGGVDQPSQSDFFKRKASMQLRCSQRGAPLAVRPRSATRTERAQGRTYLGSKAALRHSLASRVTGVGWRAC